MRLQLRSAAAALAMTLALATPTLAGAQDPPPPEPPPPPAPADVAASTPAPSVSPWDVRADFEVGGYADTDHVFVVSPSIAAGAVNPTRGLSLDAHYLVDVVSAASVDIVSTASRRWLEVRQEGSFGAAYKPGDAGVSLVVNDSSEPDYHALTLGGAGSLDLLDKSLTVLAGLSYSHDVAGRTGTPFSVFSKTFDTFDIKGGATFTLDRASQLSIVGDAILESGDQAKPYRYIAMFAPGTSVPNGASIDLVNQLRLSARPLEQLPLHRDRWALGGRYARRFERWTLRLDERLYADSWGMDASTTDVRALFDLGERLELGPHARFNGQTPVDFWQRAYLVDGFTFPSLRTGDRELGPLLSFSGGGSIRWFVGRKETPRAWSLGFDFDVTSTRYLDDLYVTNRLSTFGAFTLEALR